MTSLSILQNRFPEKPVFIQTDGKIYDRAYGFAGK